jgi:AcrR family transcriptional regulator
MARLSNTANQSGEDTRARIITATVQTLRDEGIVAATARSIARKGEFNQALIFYHFGSVTDLLVSAAKYEGERRASRYKDRLENIQSLQELVAVARELHVEEVESGGLNVLAQLLAGAASSEELRQGLMESFQPWMQLVEHSVEIVLANTPYAGVVKTEDMTYAITSLFLGIELLHTLDPDNERAASLFTSFEMLATVVETLLKALPPPLPAKPAKPVKPAKAKK